MSAEQIQTQDYTQHGTDYSLVWKSLDSQTFRVVDEDGNNTAHAEVRHFLDTTWLLRDDVDGYQTLQDFEVEALLLEVAH